METNNWEKIKERAIYRYVNSLNEEGLKQVITFLLIGDISVVKKAIIEYDIMYSISIGQKGSE